LLKKSELAIFDVPTIEEFKKIVEFLQAGY
jgi:hypothetical protein